MKKRRVVYILFIIVLVVLANISLYYYVYFDNLRLDNTYLNVLMVNEKSSITYNLETVENNYYNSKNITNYNINDVNKIDAFFNYSLSLDKDVEGYYTYFVRGILTDDTKEIKEIYNSNEYKYQIDNKKVISINQLSDINIKEIVHNNKEIPELNDAIVKYEMVVTYHIYNKEINKYISNSKTIEIDIPITSGRYLVVSPNEEKNTKEFSNIMNGNDVTYLVICMEFLGSVLLYILCIAYLIERISPKDYMNDEELEYLRNRYKKYIIKINIVPDLSKKDVLFVDNVDELVKISKRLDLPIDYIDIIKHKEAIFAVINDKEAYVYKVSVKKRK